MRTAALSLNVYIDREHAALEFDINAVSPVSQAVAAAAAAAAERRALAVVTPHCIERRCRYSSGRSRSSSSKGPPPLKLQQPLLSSATALGATRSGGVWGRRRRRREEGALPAGSHCRGRRGRHSSHEDDEEEALYATLLSRRSRSLDCASYPRLMARLNLTVSSIVCSSDLFELISSDNAMACQL
ncbi:unnamed protein product [Lampetra planeri]